MTYHTHIRIPHRGKARITFERPGPSPPVATGLRVHGKPKVARAERRYPRPELKVFDLETFMRTLNLIPSSDTRDEWQERPSEGPPVLSAYLRYRRGLDLASYLTMVRSSVTGRPFPSPYELQVDSETANTNTTFTFTRGASRFPFALAPGAPAWFAPAPEADQRATIARLRDLAEPHPLGNGLDAWETVLDERGREQYGTYTRGRILREGRLRPSLPPGPWQLSCASTTFEPWAMDGGAFYTWRAEANYEADVVEPYPVNVHDSRSTLVEVYLVPRLFTLVFKWIALYEIAFAPFPAIIPFPTTRTISIRASFYPHYQQPQGTAVGEIVADDTWSDIISRTLAYASAIREDAALGEHSFFVLDSRVLGRYALYGRNLESGQLCAILRYRFADRVVDRYCFRRLTIPQNTTDAVEIGGLATQEVGPWIEGYADPHDPRYPVHITDGF